MSDKMRHISLDVCDMQRNKLCNIYDSSINAKGQAYDIIRTREITGGNTLTFNMPFVVEKKRNFRWNYIKNEYLLRLKIDDKTDWYIIHSPKKMKNSKTISNAVACGHLSTTLKTKSLYLVFDDENGIGTIQYLLEQVLKGTGWTLGLCDTFYEKDGKTEKIRSIASEGKAGAQKLIADICTLFNAYPTYNGEEKTVDIRAMGDKGALFEMTMGRDIESLAVEYNSEDIITRLYVEGEYGEDGYVGIDDVNPTGLTYQMNFDYYKEIGSFTDEHQAALDKYYEDIAAANEIIRRVAAEIGDKENTLNTYWGQIDYVLYPIANGVITKRIVGGNVDGEDIDIAEGDEITILQGDGEYRETTAGTGADIGLTATDTYAIKFITLPAGLIGAKQVSIEAKEKQIEELRSKITDATSDAKKTDYNNRIAAYLAEIEEIYNGSEEVTGLYAMMHAAVALCMELYEINAQRTQAQEDQEQIEADFAIAMGDMLKEGYWNNENYAAGQEQFLYEDAVDMMELMSKPEVKYQVSRLSLAGQYGYTPDDIDLNMRIRVYDTDLKINDILYVSAVGEHLCSAKDDTVDLSNEDITLSGQTLDSLLTRMTKLADLIEQKNALFSRASAITENGSIHMDRLEGTINVLKNQLSSAVSSWYTDVNGNLIFESTTGKSAMMLTGDGFMIANGKLDDGSWNWRTKHHWFYLQ